MQFLTLTSHIACAQWPHVTSSYHIGQDKYRTLIHHRKCYSSRLPEGTQNTSAMGSFMVWFQPSCPGSSPITPSHLLLYILHQITCSSWLLLPRWLVSCGFLVENALPTLDPMLLKKTVFKNYCGEHLFLNTRQSLTLPRAITMNISLQRKSTFKFWFCHLLVM